MDLHLTGSLRKKQLEPTAMSSLHRGSAVRGTVRRPPPASAPARALPGRDLAPGGESTCADAPDAARRGRRSETPRSDGPRRAHQEGMKKCFVGFVMIYTGS